MAILCYGCDCAVIGGSLVNGTGLSEQKRRLKRALKSKFEEQNWYSDSGSELFMPFALRPGGFLVCMRLRPGDQIYVDAPERILSDRVSSRRTLNLLTELGVTVHSLVKGIRDIPNTKDAAEIGYFRWSEMLHRLQYSDKSARSLDPDDLYTIKVPIGWQYSRSGKAIIPNMQDRVFAKAITDALADNFLKQTDMLWMFNIKHKVGYAMCAAYEAGFPLRKHAINYERPIMADGPALPTIKHILYSLAIRPLTVRELAKECCMSLFRAYRVARRLYAYKGDFRLLNAERIKTRLYGCFAGVHFDSHVHLRVPETVRELVLSESPLINYERIADHVNRVSDSARIFRGLDGVSSTGAWETDEPSEPEPDSPDTPLPPSRQPDQEPGPD